LVPCICGDTVAKRGITAMASRIADQLAPAEKPQQTAISTPA